MIKLVAGKINIAYNQDTKIEINLLNVGLDSRTIIIGINRSKMFKMNYCHFETKKSRFQRRQEIN